MRWCAVKLLLVAFLALISQPPQLDLKPRDTGGTIDSVPAKRGDELCTKAEDGRARLAPARLWFTLAVPLFTERIPQAAPAQYFDRERSSPCSWLADQRSAIYRIRPRKLPHESDSIAS